MGSMLAAPGCEELRWLDLGCGRGQMLGTLGDALQPEQRGQVHYVGYDAELRYVKESKHRSAALGFASSQEQLGTFEDLRRLIGGQGTFDFVTLTNTLHEVSPSGVAGLLMTAIEALGPTGSLYFYDMETVTPHELGAVPWEARHVEEMVLSGLRALGVANYHPFVAGFQHRTTRGWSLHLERRHLGLTADDIETRRDAASASLSEVVQALLSNRLADCCKRLEVLTEFGRETGEEADETNRLLHLHWALSRALGRVS